MLPHEVLNAYSSVVLGFGFKGSGGAGGAGGVGQADAPTADSSASPPGVSSASPSVIPSVIPVAPAPADLERMAARAGAAFVRSGRKYLALLGLGSGALAGALAESLPAGTLCVCEQDLDLVRGLREHGQLDWWRQGAAVGLAADASPWALFLLLDRAGVGQGDTLVLPNPELAPQAKAAHKPLELLLTRSRPLVLPASDTSDGSDASDAPDALDAPDASGAPAPRLSVAAILAPSEPDLPEFFAQMPDWIAELVLVWDAASLPGIHVPDRFPVRQLARPLGADFSAQRGAMLAACTGDWVLYLDADERLSPWAWATLPALCVASAAHKVAAWHFPRLSPYPDAEHALTGFGLWPDVQLRLFRNAPSLRFVNPVHERLTGLSGAQALALDVEIEHLSRLRKGDAVLRSKLAGFDRAGAGRVRHALSAEYPSVPRALLAARSRGGPPRCLLLPPEFS